MKKNLCTLIVIILTLLTGCTSQFKVNEDIVKNISDKIIKTAIESEGKESAEKSETHKLDASDSINLIVANTVGDISIANHDSKDAVIDVKIKIKSDSKENAEKLLNDYKYSIESKSNTIKIDTVKHEYSIIKNDDRFNINLNIKIPNNIKHITVTNNVGSVKVENINGELKADTNVGDINITNSNALYKIKVDVGKISLKNCAVSGKSEFKTNTGDVTISASDISAAKYIESSTNVGNIKMTLPETSSYKAEINEFMEKQRIVTNKDGKTDIKLVTNVGKIDFN